MKKLSFVIILIIILSILSIVVKAQKTVEKQIDFTNKESVNFNFKFSDSIKIQTWNQNRIQIKAIVNINNNENNDKFKFEVTENGNMVTVKSVIEDLNKLSKQIKKGNEIYCSTEIVIYFEVFMPENKKFTVETISGNIIISGFPGEIKAKTISGFVDLTVPAKYNADVNLSTISGTIYSNYSFTEKTSKSHGHSAVKSKMYAGGKEICLKTISGDIYLRELQK